MEPKIYKITLIFDDGSNCQVVRLAQDGKEALAEILHSPSVRKHQLEHSVVDFKVEELDKPPIPPKDRFWLERRDDGVYVVIDEQRKRALTF